MVPEWSSCKIYSIHVNIDELSPRIKSCNANSFVNHIRHSTFIMISGVLLFNQKGENLIFRGFRQDCSTCSSEDIFSDTNFVAIGPRLADVFRIQVISNAQVRSPILTLGSTTFSHVKHENIYLVAVTKGNANAALVFEFLYRLILLGKGYFGKFDEEAVKNNFVLVYELLDGACWLCYVCDGAGSFLTRLVS